MTSRLNPSPDEQTSDLPTSKLTADALTALREEFPPEQISKRPSIYCRACRDAPGKVCSSHSRGRCDSTTGCGQNITSAHFHLDYVGHADVTDRLLRVDPEWNWEPLAYTEQGLPRFDEHNSLWMRLTICGKTVICYGSAPGKKGPDAIKEVIGNGIRNGAMRFGVGLSLWSGKFARLLENDTEETGAAAEEMDALLTRIRGMWTILRYVGDRNLAKRIKLGSDVIGRPMADERDLTFDEATTLVEALTRRCEQQAERRKAAEREAAERKAAEHAQASAEAPQTDAEATA